MAVIDPNLASIKYQSMTVLLDTTLEAVRTRNRTVRKELYAKAAKIRYYLKALDYYPSYIDAEKANQILQCLVVTSGINDYPVAPATSVPSTPQAIVALQGDPGPIGPRGNDGGATDFAVAGVNGNTVIDSFSLATAPAAKWDYVIVGATDQRTGVVRATWTADGASVVFTDLSTEDIGSTEDAVAFTVTVVSSEIRLNAVVTSGTWTIRGSRYYIPNQGAAVVPANTPLPDSQIFVGNASNIATARAVTGDVTINTTGVTAISAGVILNADINASAGIEVTKLAALGNNTAVVLTDGSGKLTSIANGTAGQVLTSNGAGSPSWQAVSGTGTVTSINASGGTTGLSFSGGPVTTTGTLTLSGTLSYANGGTDQTFYTQGDLIYASAANTLSKRAIGTTGQSLIVISGVPTWQSISAGVTNVAGTTYTLLTTDHIVHLNSSSARTLTLFAGSSAIEGRIYWIKDGSRNAGTNAITVQAAGADTFEDSSTSFQITGDGDVVGVYWGNSKWNLI